LGAFCVNEVSEKQVQKFVSKTSVVHHSIDIGDYQKKENLNKIVRPLKFVFLGSFDSRKNVPLILDWISKSTNCFEFHFIGKGELSNKIKEMAIKDKRVHYEGFISKKEIKKRLCEYDFLVLPSKEEPFGIVLIEAFSAGVPCIVSNAPGPREIVCDGMTGFLFDLENEKANFASVMDKIFCLKDEKISSMRKYAALEAEKYDTRNVVKLWIDLMDSCK
jgi:glycosyltransferase involved in cell wall biosynthesis